MATVTDRTLTGSKVPGQRAPGGPVGADDDAPAPRTRRTKLIGAAVLLVALLAAGGGAFVLLGGGAAPAEEAAAAKPEHEPGAVVPLEAITINLADGRYLQVGIALQEEEAGGGEEEELDGSRALDILIGQLSGRAMAELAGADQREAVKAELVAEISEAYEGHVYDIYFTSFVMQ